MSLKILWISQCSCFFVVLMSMFFGWTVTGQVFNLCFMFFIGATFQDIGNRRKTMKTMDDNRKNIIGFRK